MKLGTLDFTAIVNDADLVAEPVKRAIKSRNLSDVYVAKINPDLADTAAFCKQYKIGMNVSANCVVVEAKRADKTWYTACIVLATSKADVNGIIRRHLNARKTSFAPMDKAVAMTGMEYGGITPIGLPGDWPILIDSAVIDAKNVIIGSGIRQSKLLIPAQLLKTLPNAVIMDITKKS